ncbi:MAG: SCO family protein [Chloroflexota bacterium]
MTGQVKRYALYGIISILSTMIVILLGYIAYLQFAPVNTSDVPAYLLDDDGITPIEPPLPIPNATLTDQSNQQIDIASLDKPYTLLTFGFTHCPDICPITLGEYRRIYDDLGTNADEVNFVFVSVDGDRDTPLILATYFETLRVDNFVIGLTGTENEIAFLTNPLGVEFIKHEPDQFGNYNVDHTAGMFLLDADGNWIRRYRYGIRADIIADDIRALIN